MIIAGIDEAGLGPKLGPLVVSSSAFWLDDELYDIENTSLWEVFSFSTTDKHIKGETKLLIADSKIAYKVNGIDGLKESVLHFCSELFPNINISNLSDLLSQVCVTSDTARIPESKWFAKSLDSEAIDTRLILDTLPKKLSGESFKPVALKTKILTANMLNELYATGMNKSDVLLSQSGSHIKHIVESFPKEKIKIVVDKQGGKTYYAPFLMDTLDGAWIDIIREGAGSSLYKVGKNIQIEFLPKADKNEFSVALASILSKFLREIFMDDFNKYFLERTPELRPTAGYPADAPRFLDDIVKIIEKEGISKHMLWRER